ncbi:MAG: YidC/Oxa1 family membrane protein insertase [Finegoldia sp.]|nr:YidC/Oxa1 family membrane protein insertase [Finegoldia sp.]
MQVIANFFGSILRFIYENLQASFAEPASISFFAISILLLTFVYKLVTIPVTINNQKNQIKNAAMQQEMQQIQKKYSRDPQTMQRKMQELYKKHNFNPASGCLPILVQMILIFALFRVMRDPSLYMFDNATQMDAIAKNFLWVPDLTKADPYWFGLPLINGLTQFLVSKVSMPKPEDDGKPKTQQELQMQSMNNMMMYGMPIMMFVLFIRYASGLILYWSFSNIIEVIIRFIMNKSMKKQKVGGNK